MYTYLFLIVNTSTLSQLAVLQDQYPMDAYTSDYMIDGNQMAIVGEQIFMHWDNRVHCSV